MILLYYACTYGGLDDDYSDDVDVFDSDNEHDNSSDYSGDDGDHNYTTMSL